MNSVMFVSSETVTEGIDGIDLHKPFEGGRSKRLSTSCTKDLIGRSSESFQVTGRKEAAVVEVVEAVEVDRVDVCVCCAMDRFNSDHCSLVKVSRCFRESSLIVAVVDWDGGGKKAAGISRIRYTSITVCKVSAVHKFGLFI